MTTIKFGTSGWRAIIADEFTFANVRLVAEAVARYIRGRTDPDSDVAAETGTQAATPGPTPTILVGYDTRFASDSFARQVANVLSASGIRVQLAQRPVPTPAVSFAVRHRKLAGAVNLTASHNAGEYNGIKFSTSDGAPALPEVTSVLERTIAQLQADHWTFTATPDDSLIETVDIRDEYFADIATKVDLDVIRKSGIRIGYDPLHGVGSGHLDRILTDHGITPVVLHAERDVYFGTCDHPEPDEHNLAELRQRVVDDKLDLGLGNDGDADRFGVIDSNGEYIHPNDILALLFDYLIETRGWEGAVARTVATTHLIDRVARLHGREVYETPVGFKYIGQYLEQDKIVLGGEESAGLTIKGHLPEKDGILACLLVAELVARRGKSLTQLKKALFDRTGPVYNRRLNIRLDPSTRRKVDEKIAAEVPEFFGRKVDRVDRTDGLKLIFGNGDWVLMRPSGTEPVVRFYAEAGTIEELDALVECGKQWTGTASSANRS
jgi:alpha-D-glucose phosphate-specific phosphoglucomutase